MIKAFLKYITEEIWTKKEHEYNSRKMRWLASQIKVFIFTIRGFGEHSLLVRSAALTFYTLMSVVPIAALVFGIAKGFGIETKLNNFLYAEFSQYAAFIDQFIAFANALLLRTKGGVIAGVGFVVLFWAVMKVFGNVENAFNNIWEVRKSRSFARKFSDYLTVIFITPILWTMSSSIRLHVQDYVLNYAPTPVINFLFTLASLVMLWVMFAFIYKVMPNTRVKFRSAITAGIVAGTLFHLFQVVYVYIQTEVSSYNAIYGSFAAVPLFLIWLQTSWQILLVGAELSFSYQNIKKFEYEKMVDEMSYNYRKKVMLVVMHSIIKHFQEREESASSESIAGEVNLPVRMVRDVLFDLERAGLVAATVSEDEKVHHYIPGCDIHSIRLLDVILNAEQIGKEAMDLEQSPEFNTMSHIVDRFNISNEGSTENVLLMDIEIGK